jgi:hypothetical protein
MAFDPATLLESSPPRQREEWSHGHENPKASEAMRKPLRFAPIWLTLGPKAMRMGATRVKHIFVRILAVAALSGIACTPTSAQGTHPLRLAQAKSADTQAIEKLDMSAVPDLDRATVRRIQRVLRTKGFDPGPANGVAGDKTITAVKKFQERFGIKGDGAINNQTLFALGVVGTESPAAEKENDKKQEASRPTRKQEREKSRRASSRQKKQQQQKNSQSRSSRTLWCAEYSGGGRNCGFSSAAQCRAAVSGIGGGCYQQ